MKLSARQKYDYRDLERGEAQLISIGHALWRDRRKLGDTVIERGGINATLETVWQAKREYGQNWPKRGLCDSQSIGKLSSNIVIFLKPFFLPKAVPSDFRCICKVLACVETARADHFRGAPTRLSDKWIYFTRHVKRAEKVESDKNVIVHRSNPLKSGMNGSDRGRYNPLMNIVKFRVSITRQDNPVLSGTRGRRFEPSQARHNPPGIKQGIHRTRPSASDFGTFRNNSGMTN